MDCTGPEPMRVEGDSFEDVAKKTLQHRLQNGRAPGNPGAEIIDYVCGTWPHVCRDDAPAPIPASVSSAQPLNCA